MLFYANVLDTKLKNVGFILVRLAIVAVCIVVCIFARSTTFAQSMSELCELESRKGEVSACDKAIEEDPSEYKVLNNRGRAWFIKGDNTKAILDSSEAIRLNPDYADAYFIRGLALASSKNYDKAIEDFTKGIQIDNKHYDMYFNRGRVWHMMGKIEKAIEDHTMAIKLQPDQPTAYYYRGDAYFDLKNYSEAIQDYSYVMMYDHDKVYPDIYWKRGYTFKISGYLDSALKDFDKELERIHDRPADKAALETIISETKSLNDKVNNAQNAKSYVEAVHCSQGQMVKDLLISLSQDNPLTFNAYFNAVSQYCSLSAKPFSKAMIASATYLFEKGNNVYFIVRSNKGYTGIVGYK